jgi:hypothetical protein
MSNVEDDRGQGGRSALPRWQPGAAERLLIMIAGCASLAGCASGATTFRSNTSAHLATTPPIERLMVLENIGAGFTVKMYRGFLVALERRLTVCGVASRAIHVGSLDVGIKQDIEENAKQFLPGALLSIRAAGGLLKREQYEYKNTLHFDLQLLDIASNKPTWVAEATFDVSISLASDDAASGVRFATSGKDWPAIDTRPDCQEERRRALAKVRQAEDHAERVRLLQLAPTCE